MTDQRVWIATNNGDIGGGEVMLLHIATALRELGRDVTVVGPSEPAALVELARAEGFDVEVLPARDRRTWMLALRRWDRRHRRGILWCNGLVPAMATAGRPGRIVHLHQVVSGRNALVARVARAGALATIVPSQHVADAVPGSRALQNWTTPLRRSARIRRPGDPFVVGYLGRLSNDKGVSVLASAIGRLERQASGPVRVRLAGEARFVSPQEESSVSAALAEIRTLTDQVGWVPPQDLFDAVDVLVVPSVVPESFGLVAAEAMAAEVSVIVSDAGALPEVVGQEHGMIVPAGDPQALAAALQAVMLHAKDPEVVAQRARWEEMFSPDAGRARVAALLAELVRSADGAGR